MLLTINREIFDRVKTAIAETGRIDMLSWARSQNTGAVESVREIRMLPLLHDCRTTACIGGLACYLATLEEIACTAEFYGLSKDEVQEPPILGAALLLGGAEKKTELQAACQPLFCLLDWPVEEHDAYNACQSDAERSRVVVRRMDNWAAEIEARQSTPL